MLLHFRIKSESLHSRFQNWATEDGATAAMCVASVVNSHTHADTLHLTSSPHQNAL